MFFVPDELTQEEEEVMLLGMYGSFHKGDVVVEMCHLTWTRVM